MIGRELSHFRVLEEIGAGGMGVVYRALDLSLNRPVALKVLPADALADADRRQRFLREAQAASALNHPNIVTIYEIGSQDGVDFIAMEFVEGRSLQAAIPPNGLPVAQAVAYANQIADALAYAHERGVIHRDLKTANIRLTPWDRVKVLDFGLAKLVRTAGAGDSTPAHLLPTDPATALGLVLGTPQYMSPEQAQGKPVDARSDLFSFGCVLYEMLTGRNPFAADNPTQTLSAILRDDPPSLGRARPDVPPELERIVEKTLEKEPRYRYQHATELLADLKKLERDSIAPNARTSAIGKRLRRRWPAAWPLAALGLLALGALIGWRAGGASPTRSLGDNASLLPGNGVPPTYRTIFAPSDFRTVRGDGEWRYFNSGQIFHVGGPDDFWTPVHLPDGAQLIQICFHVYDADDVFNISAGLSADILYATNQPPGHRTMAETNSQGVSGHAVLCAKPSDPLVTNVEDIDRDGQLENFAYRLVIGLPAPGDSERFSGAYIDWQPAVTR